MSFTVLGHYEFPGGTRMAFQVLSSGKVLHLGDENHEITIRDGDIMILKNLLNNLFSYHEGLSTETDNPSNN